MRLPTTYTQCAYLLQSTELISEEIAEFCSVEVQRNFNENRLNFAILVMGTFGVVVFLTIIRCTYLSIALFRSLRIY
jgi:hypothetical protein